MWKRFIFYLLFACPMANLWPFSSGQRLSPNVNHFICQFSTWRLLGVSLPCWALKPSWIWTWYLSIQYQGLNPLGHSPHKGLFLSIMCNQLDSATKELVLSLCYLSPWDTSTWKYFLMWWASHILPWSMI